MRAARAPAVSDYSVLNVCAANSYGDGENWDSGEIGENIPATGDYVIYS